MNLRRSRGTRTLEARPGVVVLAGLLTTAAIIGFLLLALNAYNGIPLVKYRTLKVSLPNIGHLKKHDPVDIAGVRVGQVLHTSTKDNRALIELQLRGVGPLAQDTRAVVRAQGLLGARFVDVIPGDSSEMLPDGATITMTKNSYTSGVPETLDLFDGRTRTALRQMVRGLGEGLRGRGTELNQAIRVGPQSGADFNVVAEAITARRAAAANFLPALRGGFGALNEAKEDIANSFRPAAETTEAIVDERDAVDRSIEQMPAWFPLMRERIGTLDAPRGGIEVMYSLQDLAASTREVIPGVPSALRSASMLLEQAAEPLAKARPVVDEIPRSVPAALDILDAVKPNIRPLRQAFDKLLNPVTNLARHGCDIQNFSTATRSMVSWGTDPGGGWGPNVGFPLAVVLGPQQVNNAINTHIPYPTETPYDPPCANSPGPVINDSYDFQLRSELPK